MRAPRQRPGQHAGHARASGPDRAAAWSARRRRRRAARRPYAPRPPRSGQDRSSGAACRSRRSPRWRCPAAAAAPAAADLAPGRPCRRRCRRRCAAGSDAPRRPSASRTAQPRQPRWPLRGRGRQLGWWPRLAQPDRVTDPEGDRVAERDEGRHAATAARSSGSSRRQHVDVVPDQLVAQRRPAAAERPSGVRPGPARRAAPGRSPSRATAPASAAASPGADQESGHPVPHQIERAARRRARRRAGRWRRPPAVSGRTCRAARCARTRRGWRRCWPDSRRRAARGTRAEGTARRIAASAGPPPTITSRTPGRAATSASRSTRFSAASRPT